MKKIKLLLRPEIIFFVLALICCSFAALCAPAGGGADEPSHIARTDQILKGHFLPQEVDREEVNQDYSGIFGEGVVYGGEMDQALCFVTVPNMQNYQALKDPYRFPTWTDPNIRSDVKLGEGSFTVAFSNTAVNNPVVYLPYVLGDAVFRLFTDNAYAVILGMRMFGVLFFCFSIAFCIYLIPIGKWIMVTISLLPSTVACLSTVTGDLFTYVAVCFFTAVFFLALDEQQLQKKHYIFLLIAVLMISVGKITYFPFIVLLFGILFLRKDFRDKITYRNLGAVFGLGMLVFLLWYLQVKDINTSLMFHDGTDPGKQMAFILSNPGTFLRSLIKDLQTQNIFNIGDFGGIGVHATFRSYGWWSVLGLMLSLLVTDTRERGRVKVLETRKYSFAFSVFVILAGIAFLVELALYLQFTTVGSEMIEGVQDRYWLPLLPILMICLLVLFRQEQPDVKDDGVVKKKQSAVAVCLMAFWQVIMAGLMLMEFSRTLFGAMWVL